MGHAPGFVIRNAEGQSDYVTRAKAAEVSQRRQRGWQQPCRKPGSVRDRAAWTPSWESSETLAIAATSELGGHTCQMVGVHGKGAQVSQRRP